MPGAKQSPEFQKAVKDSGTMSQKPENDELLEMYGLYKQGTHETSFDDAPKPGMFDMKGKAKHNAWSKVKDKKPEEAQKEYVALVKKLVAKYK